MKKLVFENYFHVDSGNDKEPMICELLLDDNCNYEPILEMYGGHYAGDRYYVYINGIKIDIDQNGDRIKPIIENIPK